MENAQIADVLDEIGDLLELTDASLFRIRAYHDAAQTVRSLPQRCEDLLADDVDLSELPHIGKSTASKIDELIHKGTCGRLLELRRRVPSGVTTLMKVPQLGPRRALLLHDALGIESIADLKKACEDHQLARVRSLGNKTEQNILRSLATLKATSGRMLLKAAGDHAEALGRYLHHIDGISRWEIAGSLRRRRETIGDLDVLVQSADRAAATDRILNYPGIEHVLSRGPERVSVRVGGALQVDFRFFDPPEFGAALLYFTGSKPHNIALRKRVQRRKWKLNEYGLFSGTRRLAGTTEAEVYARLGLAWIPPELREDRGELDAAAHGTLPKLVKLTDIRGDLHCHTKATDGAGTIADMAEAARLRGYDYLAITDHSKAVTIANGLNETRLKKHVEQIRKLDRSLDGIRLLAGVEVDILKEGQLDLDKDLLSTLDWVVGSVHSHFNLDRDAMTNRLVTAVRSGVIHCLGHPGGRIIGRRDLIQVDWDKVFAACKEHGVRIEINAQPDRLDLPDTYCQRAKAAGVEFVISTDAHKESDLDYMPFGVDVARRGWLEPGNVLNTCTAAKLRKALKRR